jgi:protein disulfide-isomerase A6
VVLTEKNFDEIVMKSSQPWMVEFFAPWWCVFFCDDVFIQFSTCTHSICVFQFMILSGHCKALAPAWKQAANNLKGIVRFGTVDATVEQSLAARFGVQGYPTIKVFGATKPGVAKKMSAVTDYQYGRSAADLIRFANDLAGPSNLGASLVSVPSSEQEFAKVLAEAGAVSPNRPLLLLFTEKTNTPPILRMLAHVFQEHVRVVEVRSHLSKAFETFQVQKSPSLMLVKAIADQTVTPYGGAIELDSMLTWVAGELGITLNGKSSAKKDAPAAEKKKAEPLSVTHVQSQDDLTKACLDRVGLCVLAWLPADELATAGGSKYVAVLKALGVRFPTRPFNLAYLDATAQYQFVEKLGGNPGDVGLVAFNPRKQRVANYYGVFAEEPVAEFLDGLVSGSVSTAPLPQLPQLVVASAPSCGSTTAASEGGAADSGKCTAPPAKDEL